MAFVPTLPQIQSEINRLFDSFFRVGEPSGETLSDWAPRVDVIEDGQTIRIYADLPGLNREEINVSVERQSLTIAGVRKQPADKDLTWHRTERLYGTFKRVFSLPTTVDPEKVSAEYHAGVLEVLLPKAEHARPRMVQIKAT